MQRGGSPTARSRLLASLFAEKAVDLLEAGKSSWAVGLQNGRITAIPLEESCNGTKNLDVKMLTLADMLSI